MVVLMWAEIIDDIAFLLYKIACLFVGLGFCYMGYRLFLAGQNTQESGFEFSLKDVVLKFSKAAPGTFYALFGAAIIIWTVWKGYSSNERTVSTSSAANESAHEVQLPEKYPNN